MIPNNQKTSLLVPSQLPEFIRDNPDYSNFVSFIQAYYQWLELANTSNSQIVTAGAGGEGTTYASKNITNYFDIDNTLDDFQNYFVNDFLPYFPQDALISKDKAVKVARQLYQTKGTPASYQFLFRILYNSDFDYYNTGDTVLKASDGTWYVPKSLKLATDDTRFLEINTLSQGTYRVFGETSKSFGTIEYVTYAGNKTEVFISNIERLFISGEIVRVVDSNNQDVIINGSNLTAKLVGQISQININPNNRGLFYNPGDPVIVYNGLNETILNPVGATAQVGTVTSGSIQRINVNQGGYGYSLSNTIIAFSGLNSGAAAPIAIVGSVTSTGEETVVLVPKDTITLKQYHMIGNIATSHGANVYNSTTGLWSNGSYNFANIAFSNANTTLANAFSFESFATYPISSILVENGGGGITSIPTITADSQYPTDTSGVVGHLASLGILGPIQIANGGHGYVANDVINFIGGAGYGAHANVTSVDANGVITSVSYVFKTGENPPHYPLGGIGYNNSNLPTLNVTSANSQAANASLYVPGILGTGATFSTTVDRAGSVTTISIINPGEDYISVPSVSLKVQDILVSNVSVTNLPDMDDIVYQGSSPNTAIYYSYFDSITQLVHNNDPTQSIWNLRVYNYTAQPNTSSPIKVQSKLLFAQNNPQVSTVNYNLVNSTVTYGGVSYTNGVKNYGDGTALATAKFLNGLVIGQGQYIDSRGQPSGFSVLQSQDYNNYTYQITVNKEIEKYRTILLNLLHPSGTKLIGRYAIESQEDYDIDAQEIINQGYSLYHYTQVAASNAAMTTTLSNPSTNTIQFYNANISTISFSNTSTILMTSLTGTNVFSTITGIDYTNNRVTISSNVFLSFANVAYVSANSGTTTINIESITNSYNIINNGIYSNPSYPLLDIVYAGDTVQIGSSTYGVQSVNAYAGTITTTSTISTTVANTLMGVNRTFSAGGSLANAGNILIYNTIGIQDIPYITDQNGNQLITEGGDFILLG